MTNNIAIITAGGSGTRLLGDVKKQFRELCGIPILIRTADLFFSSPLIHRLIITSPEEDVEYCEAMIRSYFGDVAKPWIVMGGGIERQDSIFGALQACPGDTDYVFIHDAVRPFISLALLEKLYEAVIEYKAVIPAAPPKHTIKTVDSERVAYTLDRKKLIQAYTPQVFDFRLILKCYQKAYQRGLVGTDDASIVELCGYPVHYLISSDLNLKITDETDLLLARLIIEKNIVI